MSRGLLIVLSGVWLAAAVFIGVATVALVAESGWSEMPVFAWLMLVCVFAVALPLLLYGWYRRVRGAATADI